MTGESYAQALPFPLLVASILLCVLASVLLSLGSHGKIGDGWGQLALGASTFCLVLGLIVAWSTAVPA